MTQPQSSIQYDEFSLRRESVAGAFVWSTAAEIAALQGGEDDPIQTPAQRPVSNGDQRKEPFNGPTVSCGRRRRPSASSPC